MKGTLLDFSVAENRGLITGDDGNRYTFTGPEWKGSGVPMAGARVEFYGENGAASQVTPDAAIVPAPQASPPANPAKVDKTTAGICGILLGAFGIHKFLLGYQVEGIIMLAVTLGAGFFTCGISSVVMGIIGLIEGIMYITMTQEQFDRTYVQNQKKWF